MVSAQPRLGAGSAGGPISDFSTQDYLKAAVQGHTAAQFNLGLIYGRGRGVSRNRASAQQWLRQAAGQGHPGAQYHLGVHLYQDSKRLPQAQASEARVEGYKFVQLAVRQRHRGADSAGVYRFGNDPPGSARGRSPRGRLHRKSPKTSRAAAGSARR
jgi:TPR repeat protein